MKAVAFVDAVAAAVAELDIDMERRVFLASDSNMSTTAADWEQMLLVKAARRIRQARC